MGPFRGRSPPTDLPERAALLKTLKAWKDEIRTFCLTRVTDYKTGAAILWSRCRPGADRDRVA